MKKKRGSGRDRLKTGKSKGKKGSGALPSRKKLRNSVKRVSIEKKMERRTDQNPRVSPNQGLRRPPSWQQIGPAKEGTLIGGGKWGHKGRGRYLLLRSHPKK